MWRLRPERTARGSVCGLHEGNGVTGPGSEQGEGRAPVGPMLSVQSPAREGRPWSAEESASCSPCSARPPLTCLQQRMVDGPQALQPAAWGPGSRSGDYRRAGRKRAEASLWFVCLRWKRETSRAGRGWACCARARLCPAVTRAPGLLWFGRRLFL